jgi:uncharacterized ion transporter superfamily protein YfcC
MAKNFKKLQAQMSDERQQKNAAPRADKADGLVVTVILLAMVGFVAGFATHAWLLPWLRGDI